MIVREIERRNGETTVRYVDYKTGEVLDGPPLVRHAQAETVSMSNGLCANERRLAHEKMLDARAGVSPEYLKTAETINHKGERVAAYKMRFESRQQKNKWLRSRGRVDFDAGYGDPAPSIG